MTKKKWARPMLIVLVRENSEEGALAACKFNSISGEPGVDWFGCQNFNEFALCRIDCSAFAAS